MAGNPDRQQLPEESQFSTVLWSTCIVAVLVLYLFVTLTLAKSKHSPGDITSDWFAAWGQWAGGLMTGAAFLIAAYSIFVTGAHARRDRQHAAELRNDTDMAQARQLAVYKVRMPDSASIDAIATFRIENRSNERFFDVKVPFVDAPSGSTKRIERRTPELVAADHRLHEYLPTGESLAPYMNQTDDDVWFTLVTVHTADWTKAKFAVEYTDTQGLRWRQHYGGGIERILTSEAILVRDADRFQPQHQIRPLPEDELRRLGGTFARTLAPLSDQGMLAFLGPEVVASWKPGTRIGQPRAMARPGQSSGLRLEISYPSAGEPFWGDYLKEKLGESGFREVQGSRGGPISSTTIECTEDEIHRAIAAFDEAVAYANHQFEANELASARRSYDAKAAAAKDAADRQARLDDLTLQFAKPGEAPWQRARSFNTLPTKQDYREDGQDRREEAF